MSMEHKAFIFDTNKFHCELEQIILLAGKSNDLTNLKKFIEENKSGIISPYTLDELDENWENELENRDVQEFSDFALTVCYNPEDDFGLGYDWTLLVEWLENLPLKFNSDYYILGKEIKSDNFKLDPSYMGFGLVEKEDVSIIYKELISLNSEIKKSKNEELIEVYNILIETYEQAKNQNKGLMMTF